MIIIDQTIVSVAEKLAATPLLPLRMFRSRDVSAANAVQVLLARAPVSGSFPADVLPAMLAIGIGFGMAMPALMTLGMAGATNAGLVSGIFSTSQQAGGS